MSGSTFAMAGAENKVVASSADKRNFFIQFSFAGEIGENTFGLNMFATNASLFEKINELD